MKYALIAAALAAVARAQTLADVPSCAIPCLDDAISGETDCKTTDFACICKDSNFSAIQGAATSCVIEKCGADTALNEVLPATEALCSAQGDGGDSTTSASEPETTTSEEAESTTAVETTAVETTAVETTTEAVTTTAAVTPSTTPTVAPTVVVPTNGTIPTTTVVPTGAAAAFGPVGGVALLGLAALAL